MNVMEKLVELLQDENNTVWRWFPNNMAMTQLADYLIANSVTVQEHGYLETVVEVKDNRVCRSRVPNEVSQLTKKIVGLKNV